MDYSEINDDPQAPGTANLSNMESRMMRKRCAGNSFSPDNTENAQMRKMPRISFESSSVNHSNLNVQEAQIQMVPSRLHEPSLCVTHGRTDTERIQDSMMPSSSATSSRRSHILNTAEMRLYLATRTPERSEVRKALECLMMIDDLEPWNPNITNDQLISRAASDGRVDLLLGNFPGLSDWSDLHEAVRQGDLSLLRLLLEGGANTEACTATGRTALHWAADLGDFEAVKMLVEAGAKADAPTVFGLRPLEYAKCHGHDAIFNLLLEYF